MKKDNDILQNGKNPYGVPDGYFESLRERLDSIPSEGARSKLRTTSHPKKSRPNSRNIHRQKKV